jgi:hypothetical protein
LTVTAAAPAVGVAAPGVAVGAAVGAVVDAAVGTDVGAEVGAAVGAEVGAAVWLAPVQALTRIARTPSRVVARWRDRIKQASSFSLVPCPARSPERQRWYSSSCGS